MDHVEFVASAAALYSFQESHCGTHFDSALGGVVESALDVAVESALIVAAESAPDIAVETVQTRFFALNRERMHEVDETWRLG